MYPEDEPFITHHPEGVKMPLELTAIEPSGKTRVPLEDIEPDVVQAVEEALEFCRGTSQRLEASFADKDTAEDFLHQARSYAYWRKDTTGRLVVSGNPTSKGKARFRVEEYVAPVTTGE
jgi:hypothetical protein